MGGSHDPFLLHPIIILALFQLIEMLIRVTNFFAFEQQLAPKTGCCEPTLALFLSPETR